MFSLSTGEALLNIVALLWGAEISMAQPEVVKDSKDSTLERRMVYRPFARRENRHIFPAPSTG